VRRACPSAIRPGMAPFIAPLESTYTSFGFFFSARALPAGKIVSCRLARRGGDAADDVSTARASAADSAPGSRDATQPLSMPLMTHAHAQRYRSPPAVCSPCGWKGLTSSHIFGPNSSCPLRGRYRDFRSTRKEWLLLEFQAGLHRCFLPQVLLLFSLPVCVKSREELFHDGWQSRMKTGL